MAVAAYGVDPSIYPFSLVQVTDAVVDSTGSPLSAIIAQVNAILFQYLMTGNDRVMRPAFGGGLEYALFESATNVSSTTIKTAVLDCISLESLPISLSDVLVVANGSSVFIKIIYSFNQQMYALSIDK